MSAAVVLLYGAAPGALAQRVDPLVGIWGFEHQAGPAVRGALDLTHHGNTWRVRVGGDSASAVAVGDTVRLALDGGRGTLRLLLHRGSRAAPRAMWIQPPGLGASYASPVRLRPAGAARWIGAIAPVEERFSLYLMIAADTAGELRARFRNPEGNFGGGRVFRVVRESGQLGLVDLASGRRRFTQAWDSVAQTIAFDFGTPLLARARTLATAPGLMPRVPGDGPWRPHAPRSLRDGWRTASPESQGFFTDSLATVMQRILATEPASDTAARVHAVLVARRGRLVVEEYFHGYTAEDLHDLRSASKTFTSIMLGAAMRRGARVGPATPVTPAGATIGHLLTHTSGLACNDDDDTSPGNEGTMQGQDTERDWYRYALSLPQLAPPGTVYAYCSAGINLVGQAIGRSTGEWLPSFFDRAIAQPLGITRYGVNLMPTGEGYAAGGMHLRPRDFLKFGQLYLDGGVWHGTRLVDRGWVATSTSRQYPVNGGADDGFAWHRHVLHIGEREVPSYEASGNGGQFLVVVPSLDIVVVVTAGNYGQGRVWVGIRQGIIAPLVAAARRGPRTSR